MTMAGPLIIIGGGIGGLTLALSLHAGRHRVPRLSRRRRSSSALGVGINLLPHAMRELSQLGPAATALAARAVETREMSFYNRHRPVHLHASRAAASPATNGRSSRSIAATCTRCCRGGAGAARTGRHRHGSSLRRRRAGRRRRHACTSPMPTADRCRRYGARRRSAATASIRRSAGSSIPDEGPPAYQGINMWRGVTRWKPFLSGATMVQAGWLDVGKMVIYPISRDVDARRPAAHQLGGRNPVAAPRHAGLEPRRAARGFLSDLSPTGSFDWLDCRRLLIRAADVVLEYPDGGPRSAAGLDRRARDAARRRRAPDVSARLATARARRSSTRARWRAASRREPDAAAALKAYEAERLPAANRVVLTNRTAPPDVILQGGARAQRRPAVRAARRSGQPGGTRRHHRRLQARRRLRQGLAQRQAVSGASALRKGHATSLSTSWPGLSP